MILCLLQLQDQVEPGLQLWAALSVQKRHSCQGSLMLAQQEEKGLTNPVGLGSHAETHISLWLSSLLLQEADLYLPVTTASEQATSPCPGSTGSWRCGVQLQALQRAALAR